ncbi:hypothetical protein [Asticcacaulis sp. AC402]|uniref:hypothetical protein n=1 Tax=Asticcacaulis sp. AC402 TaxID=1282361 RepID=UPI0003C40462|nr:hypothetical protein [Asticcacaulis sp. AC402]ESQ77218.1 hypothetical protein ABAC402_02105 [Asticcacaulis sp. AC402]
MQKLQGSKKRPRLDDCLADPRRTGCDDRVDWRHRDGRGTAVVGAFSDRFSGQWMETIVLGGLLARALEIAVIALTQVHQPRAEVVAATVF